MHSLFPAGILAQQQLEKRLEKHGYKQSTIIPVFGTRKWQLISFMVVVDDFGINYFGREHAEHLLAVIEADY